jgi:hypothetical protein
MRSLKPLTLTLFLVGTLPMFGASPVLEVGTPSISTPRGNATISGLARTPLPMDIRRGPAVVVHESDVHLDQLLTHAGHDVHPAA